MLTMTAHAPQRTRLPETRPSVTRKATICGFEFYITVGFFDEGGEADHSNRAGEVFVKLSKHGTEISGLLDTITTFLSIALQYGVPWEVLRDKMLHMRFGAPDPAGKDASLIDGLAKHIDAIILLRAEMLGIVVPAIKQEGPRFRVFQPLTNGPWEVQNTFSSNAVVSRFDSKEEAITECEKLNNGK